MSNLRNKGDFRVNELRLKSLINERMVDLMGSVTDINIFEDVESTFMSGLVTIIDTQRTAQSLPIIGNEILYLDIITQDDAPIKGEFFVYKVGAREEYTAKLFKYSIFIISIEALFDINTVLSAPFTGKPHEIAEQMVQSWYLSNGNNTTKNYLYEEAINDTKVIPQFWHPKVLLNYLCDHAINKDGQADFMFYENRNGFNFNTFDILIDNLAKTKKTDYEFIKTDNIEYTIDDKNVNSLYKNIISISVPESNDYISNVKKGIYGSLMFAFDVNGQNLFGNVYDAREQYKKVNYLNPYPMLSPGFLVEPAGAVFNRTFALNNFQELEDTSNTSWIQHRISRLGAIKSQVINISCYGRTGYTVGTTSNLIIIDSVNTSNSNTKTQRQSIDGLLSGNYINAKIRHNFNLIDTEYICDIELWKDSLIVDSTKTKE